MRRLFYIVSTLAIAVTACNNNQNKIVNNNDSSITPVVASVAIDSSIKSDFHFFADGIGAPDYNKSINDFKTYLAKKTGGEITERLVTVGESKALVAEIYSKKDGEFLGFSGDTSTFNWHNLKGEHLTKRLKKLIVKYDLENAFLIDDGKISIGMTSDEVIESWGRANDINKTISVDGTHEQWIYDANYLYFDNGKLTTIQE